MEPIVIFKILSGYAIVCGLVTTIFGLSGDRYIDDYHPGAEGLYDRRCAAIDAIIDAQNYPNRFTDLELVIANARKDL